MSDHWIQAELFAAPATKRCGRCGALKPLAAFHRRRASRDGLQGYCCTCDTNVAKQFHADNAEHCRERISRWVRRIDQENKRRVLDHLLLHPCVDCGEADPIVLEFDHQRDKVSGIAQLLHAHVKWGVIAAEIKKCEVRCANCHRRRTAIRGGWFRAVADPWAARGSNPDLTD